MKDEYKRRILGIVKDLKFDGDFEAINQKKMAKLTQAVENVRSIYFKKEKKHNQIIYIHLVSELLVLRR